MGIENPTLNRKNRLLITIASVALVALAYLALTYSYVLQDLPLPGRPKLVEWNGKTDPNLKVIGVIEELELNYRIDGGLSFHRFPAYIVLNNTMTQWTSEDGWNNQTRICVGYDYKEVAVHSFSVGMIVEVSGCWLPIIDHSPYLNMIVVGPLIYGSYVKPL